MSDEVTEIVGGVDDLEDGQYVCVSAYSQNISSLLVIYCFVSKYVLTFILWCQNHSSARVVTDDVRFLLVPYINKGDRVYFCGLLKKYTLHNFGEKLLFLALTLA